MTDKLHRILTTAGAFADSFLFGECLTDLEQARRARLITCFGFLGFVFGMAFATFYVLIDHRWGAFVVIVCSFGFVLTPVIMKALRSLEVGGNLLAGIMTVGFAALSLLEGGLAGHAVAWQAIVPLCAMLLVGKKATRLWLGMAVVSMGGVMGLALAGKALHPTYPAEWEPIVSTAGYMALVMFLFFLGMIFESLRDRAFKKMQDALRKLETSNNELMALNKEKNEFLAIAAHDLRNPLTSIIISAESISETNPAPQHASIVEDIVEAGTRMRDLIKELLDANAIETGRYITRLQRCDLAILAGRCIAENESAATRKKIELKHETAGELFVWADRKATMQVLDNLISNAVKYSPHHTTVVIRGFLEGGQAGISVIDAGPGISEEDKKKMFGKFVRLSARPTGGEPSSGLGLSIAKRLAELMSGTITCTSVLGEGATFSLHLPRWSEASMPEEPGRDPGKESSRILTPEERSARGDSLPSRLMKWLN